jgi:flagellar assembly protein FliH
MEVQPDAEEPLPSPPEPHAVPGDGPEGASERRGAPEPPPVSAEELAALRHRAQEEGYAQGLKKGLHQAEAQVHAKVAELDRVLTTLSAPLDELDQSVEHELVLLALTVAKQIVRREVSVERDLVRQAVRQGVALLPAAQRRVRLHLSPADAGEINDYLNRVHADHDWEVVEDAALSPGGCRLETESSEIDLSVERRIADVVHATLEGGS